MPLYGDDDPAPEPEPSREHEGFDPLVWLLRLLIVFGITVLAKASAAWFGE